MAYLILCMVLGCVLGALIYTRQQARLNIPEAVRPLSERAARNKVFVVDDDPELLEVFDSYLREDGFEVVTFRDPKAALRAFCEVAEKPALIITDFFMRPFNGVDLLNECRNFDPAVRGVLISGTVNRAILKSLRSTDRFLSKPFHLSRLIDVTRDVLGTNRPPARLA